MFRALLAASAIIATVSAAPAMAVTSVVTFSPASCSVACVNTSLVAQSFGDTADVDLTYRATAGIGNTATAEGSLRYWNDSYSNSPAAYAQSGFGEIRFDVLTPGTLTLDSIDLGGWPNTPRTIAVRVYDLSYNLLASSNPVAPALSLLTVNFGQSSTSGLIFQFGLDGFNGGIQNVTFSFNDGTDVVPEPASWAMLIAGFGLVGATLRRRRSVAA
jgi:hypothetical protein